MARQHEEPERPILTASLTTGVARVTHGMQASVRLIDEINGHDDTEPAASALDEPPPAADAVPVSVLVQEAREAGVVDWLADRIVEQCRPHGIPFDGDGGLLPALAAAAYERVASRPSGPVTIEVTYDPDRQRITANVAPGTTLATLGAACLALAFMAADLHPSVEIHRAGTAFRCL
jgi:hypothetical protein